MLSSTLYTLPGPHSCFTATTALRFDITESDQPLDGNSVVVSGIHSSGDFERRVGLDKVLARVQIGDRLVTFNGMSFKEVLKIKSWCLNFALNSWHQYADKVKWNYGGANDYGSQRSALSSMGVIPGYFYPMPESNTASFVLESFTSREAYNLTLPVNITITSDEVWTHFC